MFREQRRYFGCSHVEPAGIGAEGRHDKPGAVGDETARGEAAATPHDGGDGVEMSSDLKGAGEHRLGQMAQAEGA